MYTPSNVLLKLARCGDDNDSEPRPELCAVRCIEHSIWVTVMIELPPGSESLVNDILVWIGYGTVVGLLAKGAIGSLVVCTNLIHKGMTSTEN